MINQGPNFRAMMRINFLIMIGCGLMVIAWLLQPNSKDEWRSGILAVLYGLGGILLVLMGLKGFWDQVVRDWIIYRYRKDRRDPHSDGLAGNDTLRDSGVVD